MSTREILDILVKLNEYNTNCMNIHLENNKNIILSINKLTDEIIRQRQPTLNIQDIFQSITTFRTNVLEQNEIESLTRCCLFSSIINPINTQCYITLNNFEESDEVVQINKCKHIFHKESIYEALKRDSKCPCCRVDIRDIIEEITFGLVTER
jgi:hypothetical protein